MSPSTILSALTIAGSDSGGGAGIQADLKAFAAHGVHGLSAIAALTAQHTRGVTAVHVPPLDFLQAQIDACFDDFQVHAVKLGMLANADVIHLVADALEKYQPTHVVLDPVMVATSGAKLLEDSALRAMRERLLPLATLLTPNTPKPNCCWIDGSKARKTPRTPPPRCWNWAPARSCSRAATWPKAGRSWIATSMAPPVPSSPMHASRSMHTAPAAPWPRLSPRNCATGCGCPTPASRRSTTSRAACSAAITRAAAR
jgi:Hydroxymethylpyrimidine/phosphomethylpyrimidine kinase